MLVRCHGNQGLDTGETQVRHLLCTADILVQLRMDADTLIAALLKGCLGRPAGGEELPATRFGPGIAGTVADLDHIDQLANVDAVIAAKPAPPTPSRHQAPDRTEVIVEGVGELMTRMAQCCKPIPYDEIMGFVTRGRGVTIHRRDCANVVGLPAQEQTRLI